jgi:hypothetical protein
VFMSREPDPGVDRFDALGCHHATPRACDTAMFSGGEHGWRRRAALGEEGVPFPDHPAAASQCGGAGQNMAAADGSVSDDHHIRSPHTPPLASTVGRWAESERSERPCQAKAAAQALAKQLAMRQVDRLVDPIGQSVHDCAWPAATCQACPAKLLPQSCSLASGADAGPDAGPDTGPGTGLLGTGLRACHLPHARPGLSGCGCRAVDVGLAGATSFA